MFKLFNIIPPKGVDVLWRAEPRRYSYVVDSEREIYGTSDPQLHLFYYEVKHRTPCGARLFYENKFVNLKATKRFACNTRKEAVESLIARRKRQVGILGKQFEQAQMELLLAEKAYKNMNF